MEKFCPVCGRGYDTDIRLCEDDGERLVIVSEEPSMVGRELEGKYKLTDELGEGGMGSVYLAYQSTMAREVAVKVLKRQYCQNKLAIKRFLREARAASKLAHPNTITVYDFGQTADGLLYMVMEKLNGRPLADLMDDEGALHPERAVHIMAQVCDSLAEAHANGITHRDLKPENIFIEPKFGNPEHVKVLDFGIAKMNEDGNTQATATGMICGTPSYMSPEQAMGKQIDGRSDIYALGILLYEMLAADRPFEGDTAMEVMLKHLNEPPPPFPPEVAEVTSPALIELIHMMLAKRAEDRPADCMALKDALLQAVGNKATSSGLSQLKGPKRIRQSTIDAVTNFDKSGMPSDEAAPKKSWLWMAVAAVVLIAGGMGAYFAAQSGGAESDTAAALAGTDGGEKADSVKKDRQAGDGAKAVKAGAAGTDDSVKAGDKTAKAAPASDAKQATVAATPTAAATPAPVPPGPIGSVTGDAIAKIANDGAKMKASPPVEMVNLTVNSNPPGCLVWDGKNLLGQTPLTFARPKNSGTVKLRITSRDKKYKEGELYLGTLQSYTGTARLDLIAGPKPKTRAKALSSGNRPAKKKKRKKKKGGGIGTF